VFVWLVWVAALSGAPQTGYRLDVTVRDQGNLALGGVPTDPELAAAIARHRLFYRAKPYSARQLARDIHTACEGTTR